VVLLQSPSLRPGAQHQVFLLGHHMHPRPGARPVLAQPVRDGVPRGAGPCRHVGCATGHACVPGHR
jgi:hypothetical protein